MAQTTSPVLSAARVATTVAGFDRSPAYAGLAEALIEAIGDGRLGHGARLPSERDLTTALGVSRTTVTRAYAMLREQGYAQARHGSGTYTRLPHGRSHAPDRVLLPSDAEGVIDLTCAAASAPPGLLAAFTEAAADLPAYLGGHGYFPAGLPPLQEAIAATYEARGLPTRPDQIIVTPGALSAAAIVARALTGRGSRVLVESPVYPNATESIRSAGARLVPLPVDAEGWDLEAIGSTLRQVRAAAAYLVPDFQNPTGHVMTADQRAAYAAHLRAAGTVAIVDEAHQALALDGQEMPPPFAAFAPGTVTLGSASKSFWGGLRLGWIRAPRELVDDVVAARLVLDLGAPVLEQLVLARLLARGPVLPEHLARLRAQRGVLLDGLAEQLPDWTFHRPGGGLAVWCRLPRARATALAREAERRDVALTAGPVFAVAGGLDRFVRIPWARPVDDLRAALPRLAEAWAAAGADGDRPVPRGRDRVLVA
ncbi:PLP-dependent aminotransferase family protein [Nocardioides sp.]|uniref:MocR-like transcription factor YczR n=1 Tax=Nocardioides sp. TaxID=35761 RepID=UPI00351269DC